MSVEVPLAPALETLQRQLLALNRGYHPARIHKAFAAAQRLYSSDPHWMGTPMVEHISVVLQTLLPFQPDEDAVIACLLHHVLDTKRITLIEIEEEFGQTVRSLVGSIHLLSQVQMQNTRNSIDDLRLMLLSVSDDVRVLLIVLCDRASLMDHLASMKKEDRKWICENVLYLFAPVAARLGIHTLKQKMEALAFPVLYPTDAVLIQDQLHEVHVRYGHFLQNASTEIRTALAEQHIPVRLEEREKQPYSIFQKIREKSLVTSIDRLPDLFAIRVIVPTEEDCYRVLGILHRIGRPAVNRFKDYIAFAKPNGYRSLHTTMARFPGVPDGVFIEIQIRTEQMHREAEYGIAAHWSYKEKGSAEKAADRIQLHEVLHRQQTVEGGDVSDPSIHLVDHIYALTPTGDILELPEGATPLDFAFQIHTDLGLSFKSARVNGKIVPLNYELENGDVVEVVRNKTPIISPDWMQMVKMASSRARLKRYLASLHRDDFVLQGKQILNEELQKRRLPGLDSDYSLLKMWGNQELSFSEREDLLMKIGQGSEKANTILSHIDRLPMPRPRQKPAVKTGVTSASVEVEGGLPMPTRFAKCCKPEVGAKESIVGFVSRGCIMIHRAGCRMVKQSNTGRRVGTKWAVKPAKVVKKGKRGS